MFARRRHSMASPRDAPTRMISRIFGKTWRICVDSTYNDNIYDFQRLPQPCAVSKRIHIVVGGRYFVRPWPCHHFNTQREESRQKDVLNIGKIWRICADSIYNENIDGFPRLPQPCAVSNRIQIVL